MPITNTNLGFTLKRNLDYITVQKTGVRTITVEVFYKKIKKVFTSVKRNLIADPILNIKIPFQDGQYKLRITSTALDETFEYEEYLFNNYNSLLDNIIEQSQDLLCGCLCENCEDCGDKENERDLIFKMLSFYILNHQYYSFFFNKGLKCIDYDIMQDINCIIANDYIKGDSNMKDISIKIIGYFYYILYLGEKSIYTCCTEEIDSKFNIHTIYNCLVENKINVDCIENNIVTDPDYYITDSNFIKI